MLFSCQVVSDSLRPPGLQRARLPCLLHLPEFAQACVHWISHLTISSSVALFSFCLQSFPASESFPVSQLFTSGGRGIEAPASESFLPMSPQGWFKIDLLAVQGTLEYSPAQQFESISSSVLYLLYSPALSVHDYWKTTALAIWTFVGKVMSLLSNTV